MTQNVLVIGSNGTIAQEVVSQLCADANNQVFTISRTPSAQSFLNQEHSAIDSRDESQVLAFVLGLKERGIVLSKVICTTGVLHVSGDKILKPEKRLEDINTLQLAEYFSVNTMVPALWLKHLIKVIDKAGATIIFFSARVGSISENGLGGWYGYRASKAALNMIVKTASIEYRRRAPNTILGCYHPGTVDTSLSKPFQANVKPGKLFTPEFTVSQLLSHIQHFNADTSPYYFDWDGKSIAY